MDSRRSQLERANKNRFQKGAKTYNKEIIKDKARDMYEHAESNIKKFLSKIGANAPDHYKDSVTAAMMGVHVQPTAENKALSLMDRARNFFDPGSAAHTEGAKERHRPFQGYNKISKQTMNIDYLSNFSDKDREFWKSKLKENVPEDVFENYYNEIRREEKIKEKV